MVTKLPAMVRNLAARILRESRLPGRAPYTEDEALRIASAKLREYGYLWKRKARLTKAGRTHKRKRSAP